MSLRRYLRDAFSIAVLGLGSVGSFISIMTLVGPTLPNVIIGLLLITEFVTVYVAYGYWRDFARLSTEKEIRSVGGSSIQDDPKAKAYYDIGFGDSTNWLPWMVDSRDSRYERYQTWLDRFCEATPYLDSGDRKAHLRLVEGLRDRSKVRNEDAFGREFYRFRERARSKYKRLMENRPQ